MDLGLRGKVVLITGGSKGIGLACAREFLSEGTRVAITSRDRANLDAASRVLGDVFTVAGDLTEPAVGARIIDEVEAKLGPIDVLVASAGAAKRVAPEDLNAAAWRAAMDAKFFTYIHIIDPLIKRMAARGHGVIVNIIGNGGKVATASHLSGGAANAALMLVTAGLANAYAAKGVRVVGINPGLTKTGRVAEGLVAEAKVLGISEAEALERSEQRIPAGRLGDPEEVANMTVFLASPRSSYVHGAIISMDGAINPTVV